MNLPKADSAYGHLSLCRHLSRLISYLQQSLQDDEQ